MKKEDFIMACASRKPDIVVQQFLIEGSSYFFDVFRLGEEFQFKKDIANSLDVHIRDIVIVGSGKLGFSIKPIKENNHLVYKYNDFDFKFNQDNNNEKSDLDVAIVSSKLFDEQLIELYAYTNGYSNYGYNNSLQKVDFANYILKGWLRPDKVPNDYSINSEVVKVQQHYKALIGRKVNIGLYKSWYFFENYHQSNVERIKLTEISKR
ncbi:MAG: hypothetical protein QM535_22375 [Limnohabitans sp.]|nr:hypothetical protein [Limnohabitans sp.]